MIPPFPSVRPSVWSLIACTIIYCLLLAAIITMVTHWLACKLILLLFFFSPFRLFFFSLIQLFLSLFHLVFISSRHSLAHSFTHSFRFVRSLPRVLVLHAAHRYRGLANPVRRRHLAKIYFSLFSVTQYHHLYPVIFLSRANLLWVHAPLL